jgi:hypothetical protein
MQLRAKFNRTKSAAPSFSEMKIGYFTLFMTKWLCTLYDIKGAFILAKTHASESYLA